LQLFKTDVSPANSLLPFDPAQSRIGGASEGLTTVKLCYHLYKKKSCGRKFG